MLERLTCKSYREAVYTDKSKSLYWIGDEWRCGSYWTEYGTNIYSIEFARFPIFKDYKNMYSYSSIIFSDLFTYLKIIKYIILYGVNDFGTW